ncbi:MAG: TonB-dependent receptor [Rikenellaceae bacterium]
MKHLATLKSFIFCALALMISQTSFAQVKVTGTVVDGQGETLIGVNVTVEGSTHGSLTDLDGNFEISVPSQQSVIVVSYIGCQSQSIVVGARTNIDVILAEDSQMIDDVVVVGYGVQKKSHLTGSVSQYDGDKLADMAVSSVDQALQGRIAGVNITNTTSEVGVSPQIRVRGLGSVSADSEPLIVVDGFPASDGLTMVDMNNVESIEVLKDAASAAIYGSRGANGVIIITTKSGNSSAPKYTFKSYTGIKSAYAGYDMLDHNEYVALIDYEYTQGGSSVPTQQELWRTFDWETTDWQEVGLNSSAKTNSYSFSVSGGTGDTNYYVSTSYLKEDGIMIDNNYEKFNVMLKLNTKLSDKIKLDVSIAPTYTRTEDNVIGYIGYVRTYSWLPLYHNEGSAAVTGQEVGSDAHGYHFASCDFSYYDADGVYNEVTGQSAWSTTENNQYYREQKDDRFDKTYGVRASAAIDIQLTKNLNLRTSNSFYYKYSTTERYHEAGTASASDTNYSTYSADQDLNLLTETTLNYNNRWGKHEFSALAGWSWSQSQSYDLDMEGTGFPTDLVSTLNAATSITTSDTSTQASETALASALARLTYSYDDKYLVSTSYRADASSKFGPDNQWGYFPSASLGWRLTEEPFMKGLDVINNVKLRASWGLTGNNDIDNYAAYNTISDSSYSFGSTGTVTAGLTNTDTTLGNTYISWEQTSEFNYGIDLSFLDSRINITADYYYAVTESMLLEEPTLAITGATNYWNNVGRVRNKGFEFDINTYNIDRKNFSWTTNFNISFNDNKLIALGEDQEQILTEGERSEVYMAQVGEKSIQFYGYETDGVWLNEDDITASGLTFSSITSPQAGTLKVVDQNGDNVIDANDRTVIGDPFADYTWGMTNMFRYKNFDFSFQLYGSMGGELINGDANYSEIQKMSVFYTTNQWISEDNVGDGQTPRYNASGVSWMLTDYVVCDASYMTLRDVTLGYTFGKDVLNKLHLSKLRLYATAQNLFYIWSSDYSGMNPESRRTSSTGNYDSPLVAGYQRGAYPVTKVITVGVDINF